MILALLVDADPIMRHVARAITELPARDGHPVVVATWVATIEALGEALGAAIPDIVVSDLSITGRGPHDALAALRTLWHGRLATLSGDASTAADSACVEAGAARWMKPMSPRELVDAIVALCGQDVSGDARRVVSEGV